MSERRGLVKLARRRGISVSRAGVLAKVSRRRRVHVSRARDDGMAIRLGDLAAANPRYGCRRLWALLRREGRVANLKRVRRLCWVHGSLLSQRRRRKRHEIGVACRAVRRDRGRSGRMTLWKTEQ